MIRFLLIANAHENIAWNIDNLYLISPYFNNNESADRFGKMKQTPDFNFAAVVVVM